MTQGNLPRQRNDGSVSRRCVHVGDLLELFLATSDNVDLGSVRAERVCDHEPDACEQRVLCELARLGALCRTGLVFTGSTARDDGGDAFDGKEVRDEELGV